MTVQVDALFLFDTTGYAAEPFTQAGWKTAIVDTANVGEFATNPRASVVLDWNILEREDDLAELARSARFIFGFPPCDDLAVSGAKHFKNKAADKGPQFQLDAVHLARSVERIAAKAGRKPHAAENPMSRLSTLWRKPDYRFQPWEFGGWLPEDDVHPDYPKYIAPRDAYPKNTGLWIGNGFILPEKRPVEPEPGHSRQFRLLGGSSAKTKRIRSASPRGFFTALLDAHQQQEALAA